MASYFRKQGSTDIVDETGNTITDPNIIKTALSGYGNNLDSVPVFNSGQAVRYGDSNPYSLYTKYRNTGGNLSMQEWESQGRPVGGQVNPATDFGKTSFSEEDATKIKEDTRQSMQATIDAINANFADLIKNEEQAGAKRLEGDLGRARAFLSKSGTYDSPLGQTAVSETTKANQEYTSKNVRALENERSLKILSITDTIDQRAKDAIAAAKLEAKGNYEAFRAYQDEVRGKAEQNAKGLASQGVSLSTLKANKQHYDQLKFETGKDDFSFDLWYDAQAPKPSIVSTQFVPGANGQTKAVIIKQGPDGKIYAEEQQLNITLPGEKGNYKPQFAPDGTLFLMPEKFDQSKPIKDQIIQYGAEGQFSKPKEPDEGPSSYQEWLYAGGEKGTGETYAEWAKGEPKAANIYNLPEETQTNIKILQDEINRGTKRFDAVVNDFPEWSKYLKPSGY